jgi:hypothetical protein
MALRADDNAVFLQHCRPVAAVHGVTFVAVFIYRRMDICFITVPCKGVLMTVATHLALFGAQEVGGVPGMGTVAVCAAVPRGGRCMIMDTVGRFLLVGVAAETGVGIYRAADFFMTIIATRCKRFMQKVAYDARSITAMRVVARQTPLDRLRIVFVQPLHLLTGMTGHTDFIRTTYQQLVIVCSMRPVTCHAITLGKGGMRIGIFFLQTLMT